MRDKKCVSLIIILCDGFFTFSESDAAWNNIFIFIQRVTVARKHNNNTEK